MKKRLIAVILTAILTVLALVTLVACNKKNDPTVLNIVCLNKGYGKEWIEEIVAKWESEHDGYTVKLTAAASAGELINRNINSKNNIDDLYISVGTYKSKSPREITTSLMASSY